METHTLTSQSIEVEDDLTLDPQREADKIIREVLEDENKLTTQPQIVTDITRIISDDYQPEKLVAVVNRDPVLTAKVIKRANSAFHVRPRNPEKIDKLTDAVDRIGSGEVRSIALMTSVLTVTKGWDSVIDKEPFWRHSLAVAISARLIAKAIGHPNEEGMYTRGLLHDFGVLLLWMHDPDRYKELLHILGPGEQLTALEEEAWETNHALVGQRLFEKWGFPEELCEAVGRHHDDFGEGDTPRDVQIVALADQITDINIWPAGGDIVMDSQRERTLCQALGLDDKAIRHIKEAAREELAVEGALWGIDVGSETDIREATARALRKQVWATIDVCRDILERGAWISDSQPEDNAFSQLNELVQTQQDLEERLNQAADPEELGEILARMLEYFQSLREILLFQTSTEGEPDHVEDSGSRICPVYFGTNRNPNNPSDLSQGFGPDLSHEVYHGVCNVKVPQYRKPGTLQPGAVGRLLGRKGLAFEEIVPLDENVFWNQLTDTLTSKLQDEQCDVVVYIHGYRTSFREAGLRAAQLHCDLGVRGATAFFSWPSKASFRQYVADQDAIEASEDAITEFLLNLVDLRQPSRVHIIAHSMGNRALLNSVDKVTKRAQDKTKIPFSQIILAAPDMNTEHFEERANTLVRASVQITLYVSENDRLLRVAKSMHEFPRLGLVPPVPTADGIDTVETSMIHTKFPGHSYFATALMLLSDIRILIHEHAPPSERPHLAHAMAVQGSYWKLKP